MAYDDPVGPFDFIMKEKKTTGEKCNNVSSAIAKAY